MEVEVGRGVGESVGVALGPGIGVKVLVGEGVGVKAAIVSCTIATTVGFGVKTTSSGGNRAYLIDERRFENRQSTRSRMVGI